MISTYRNFILTAITVVVGIMPALAQSFIAEGKWRGVFHNENGTNVPFNFEVQGKTVTTAKIYFLNAEERFEASSVAQRGDSLFISFDQFENELAFKIGENKLSGVFRKKDFTGKPIVFDAVHGQTHRFEENNEKPAADISGKYDVIFKSAEGKVLQAIGVFNQTNSKLTATFLKISGDTRYLEGTVQGNRFFLSSFMGDSPAYYSGKFDLQGHITGTNGLYDITGTRNDNAALPDPYTLTYLKEGYSSFNLSLPDVNGKTVTLKDPKYKNKVVIVTITGTWCPNCIDETNFLAPWFKKNHSRGVEILAAHFEQKTDPVFVKNAIEKFKKRFGIEYDEVFGGLSNKEAVAAAFPGLNTFLSFPTILFIDKKGNVAKIYTGFNGPATGAYYDKFIKAFNAEVDNLLDSKSDY